MPVTLRIFPSGDLATPYAASATIVQLVTSRPSRETKKALPVRNSWPLASKTVSSIIAGAAFCAIETEGLLAAFGVGVVADGAGVGVGVAGSALTCDGGFRPHHE